MRTNLYFRSSFNKSLIKFRHRSDILFSMLGMIKELKLDLYDFRNYKRNFYPDKHDVIVKI